MAKDCVFSQARRRSWTADNAIRTHVGKQFDRLRVTGMCGTISCRSAPKMRLAGQIYKILTSRLRNWVFGSHRFFTNSFHTSTVLVLTGLIGVTRSAGPLLPPDADTAFLRSRPMGVGREAPLIESISDGPACDDDDRAESCGYVERSVSHYSFHRDIIEKACNKQWRSDEKPCSCVAEVARKSKR